MLTSLALIFLTGLLLASLFEKLKRPVSSVSFACRHFALSVCAEPAG